MQRPPEVSLTLKPQESFGNMGGEFYVQLDLVFSCAWNYPDKYIILGMMIFILIHTVSFVIVYSISFILQNIFTIGILIWLHVYSTFMCNSLLYMCIYLRNTI